MRVEVLGPVRVFTGSDEVTVTAIRERTLLAVLALHANHLVPVPQLVDAIWDDQPPRDGRNQVQVCVSRLRRRLADAGDAVVTEPAGYRLRVEPGAVDLWEFRRLVGEARDAAVGGHRKEARQRYRAGLGLWRGPALTGIDSDAVRRAAAALDEERLRAQEECIEVELALGAAGQLVPELTELARQHPYREGPQGALMRALYGAGRQTDALAVYRQLRELLQEELGTEPGPELRQLHRSILNRDPQLELAQPRAVAPRELPPVPRKLPAVASCFVGRDAELARVRNVLAGPAPRQRPSVEVLYGPGGVGKSALAVRAAHDLVDQFPDGQLYVDLFGSTPGMRPLPPARRAAGRRPGGTRQHPHRLRRAALRRARGTARRTGIPGARPAPRPRRSARRGRSDDR